MLDVPRNGSVLCLGHKNVIRPYWVAGGGSAVLGQEDKEHANMETVLAPNTCIKSAYRKAFSSIMSYKDKTPYTGAGDGQGVKQAHLANAPYLDQIRSIRLKENQPSKIHGLRRFHCIVRWPRNRTTV